MTKLMVAKFEMFDVVVHEPTGFIFKFFQYEDEATCSVMDEQESLYSFPVNTIIKGTKEDSEEMNSITNRKFRYLRNYL